MFHFCLWNSLVFAFAGQRARASESMRARRTRDPREAAKAREPETQEARGSEESSVPRIACQIVSFFQMELFGIRFRVSQSQSVRESESQENQRAGEPESQRAPKRLRGRESQRARTSEGQKNCVCLGSHATLFHPFTWDSLVIVLVGVMFATFPFLLGPRQDLKLPVLVALGKLRSGLYFKLQAC